MALFKRCYRLKIEIAGTIKTYQELKPSDTGLKIDFEVNQSAGGNFSNGNITITGLTQSDLAFLGTNYNKDYTLKKSLLELEVGYPDNIAMVLSGNVTKSEINFTAPDQQIRLEVMSGYDTGKKEAIRLSMKQATFKDICAQIAKEAQLTLKYDNTIENKVIGDFVSIGSAYSQIQKLRDYVKNVDITIKNKALEVINTQAKGTPKLTLDSASGLIGNPQPTNIGCVCRSLLNPALQVNHYIRLKSAKIPQLNADYRITELKHRGTNKGDLWESEMILKKV